MNQEPIKFLPVDPFWKPQASAFRFQVSSFTLGVIVGAIGAVGAALIITYVIPTICR